MRPKEKYHSYAPCHSFDSPLPPPPARRLFGLIYGLFLYESSWSLPPSLSSQSLITLGVDQGRKGLYKMHPLLSSCCWWTLFAFGLWSRVAADEESFRRDITLRLCFSTLGFWSSPTYICITYLSVGGQFRAQVRVCPHDDRRGEDLLG